MNTINISRYEIFAHGAPDDFGEVLHSIEFKYNTRHLALSGLEPAEIMKAIGRAMKICRLNNIDTADHFRPMYVFDEKSHNTYCDWRMTSQGLALVIINTPVINTAVANWQWKMINCVMPL
jgi:hypothetical protein